MRVSARLFSQLKQQQQHSLQPKLIYQGKLSNRILYLKSVSLISSLGLAGSYKYVLAKKGFSVALAGVGFAFTPFLLSPIIISWFFKRYITRLYYDPTTATYTAHHYGLLLNKKQCTFKSEDVIRSDFTSMLNTFKVGKKPFFIHDEDLVDAESVEIYKKMIGLDQVKPVADDDDGADKSAAAAKQFKWGPTLSWKDKNFPFSFPFGASGMHLIFERYKGRFRSNCNILALAWMPYYQESKFRQSLFDYHQKQLFNLTRSTANHQLLSQRLADSSNNHDATNHPAPAQLAQPLPPIPPRNGESGGREAGQNQDSDRFSAMSSTKPSQKFLNARLVEQYQRYVLSKSNPSKATNASMTNINDNELELGPSLGPSGGTKLDGGAKLEGANINDELDSKFGRMPEFGWLAIGNIGKIVGVTLTSTVPPPDEIDGRKQWGQQDEATDDLIVLDDEQMPKPPASSSSSGPSGHEGPPDLAYEQVRPDRKRVRGNHNLRGHLDEIILVKWNELYQKLATVDGKGNVLIWCKVNEKFTIQTPFYNRSKSVADFKWSNDGKTALICYTDSFILVGSSSSQRHWHSMLNLDDYHITCASWAPNDDQLLLGVSNGNVVVIDLPRSELTELVVGQANIRTMCWSTSDMNLRNLDNHRTANTDREQPSWAGSTEPLASPLRTQDGNGRRGSQRKSAIVNQRRLSRDCSVFSRYRLCVQNNGNTFEGEGRPLTGQETEADGLSDKHKNVLAIDFANNTIKLFAGGLDDPKPRKIQVQLESYLMAWTSDGKVLAVAGFNVSTSAPSIGCLRCRYLNHIKFYNQQGDLISDIKLNFTRYPITALTWAHDDRRLFLATGPRLHCARVHFGVPSLELLAMACVHRNTRCPDKVDLLNSLAKQQQRRQDLGLVGHQQHFKSSNLLNWQSFNCPLELGEMLASGEEPLLSSASSSTGTTKPDSSSSFGSVAASCSNKNLPDNRQSQERAVLKYNINIADYQLPAKLKMAVDQLFLQTLRQPFDEQLTLADIAWHVPKSQQRHYCTLICYTHELVDIGCGASLGHQYKTQELNESSSSSALIEGGGGHQSSDQFKLFVLYAEYQGSLIPILKARRIGFLKPEFVIFDPEEAAGRQLQRRQKVSDVAQLDQKLDPHHGFGQSSLLAKQQHQRAPHSASGCESLHTGSPAAHTEPALIGGFEMSDSLNRKNQLRMNILPDEAGASRISSSNKRPERAQAPSHHPLLADPLLNYLFNRPGDLARGIEQAHGSPKSADGARAAQAHREARRLAIERYRAITGRPELRSSQASSSSNLKTLPEASELVRIRSNIWGTRFKIINMGNRMIAQRAHLGRMTYKASILHLQPRQIFLDLKDMTNYCVLCAIHHHTRAPDTSQRRELADERRPAAGKRDKEVINLIDLPLTTAGASLHARPLKLGATPSRSRSSGSSRAFSSRPSKMLAREQRDENKVVLAVGEGLRVAPKLDPNQVYKFSGRPSSSSTQTARPDRARVPVVTPARAGAAPAHQSPIDQAQLMPQASTSRSADGADSKLPRCADGEDVLTLSLDQGNQVQLDLVTRESQTETVAEARRAQASRHLDEFLEENKTLKSIQTITKMIVDLSAKAHEDETGRNCSGTGGPYSKLSSVEDEQACSSPVKMLKLSEQQASPVGSATSVAARYVPPETPVHRPRRVGRAQRGLETAGGGQAVARAQSASSTPLRMFKGRGSGQFEPPVSLLHDDTPLPPPPPSIPFRRKLSSSAKRLLDGSLRSLTGVGGYSTAGEELDEAEDCEPLVSRRPRRPSRRHKLELATQRNQSQPCTPLRTPPTSSEPGRRQPLDLALLRGQLMDKFRSSLSAGRESRARRANASSGGGGSRKRATSSSQLEALSCTKKSRWVLRDASLASGSDLTLASPRSSSASSSSSSTSSLSAIGDDATLSNTSDDERGEAAGGQGARRQRERLYIMRQVERMRSFSKKSAKSLTDLAKISLNEPSAASKAGRLATGGQLNQPQPQQQRRRRAAQRRRRRRNNRKSVCQSANCCCAREFKLNNRPPVWNELSQVYQLDFGGRVTQESAKNLQIDFKGNLALQFGRVDRCTYTLDYKHPFNAVQAMAIALASLTQRLK